VVSLAGAIDVGSLVERSSEGKASKQGTGGGRGRRELPRANVIVVPPWLSPSDPLGGVADIRTGPSLLSGVGALAFSLLVVLSSACAACSALSFSYKRAIC